MAIDPIDLKSDIQQFVAQHQSNRTELVGVLWRIQNKYHRIPKEAISLLAEEFDISPLDVEGTASFYHFFSETHRGLYTIYVNKSVTSEMKGYHEVVAAFQHEIGIHLGEVSKDQKFGLFSTSCIGMCDQEPAALINGLVFTELTPLKVRRIVENLKKGCSLSSLMDSLGDGQNSHPLIHSEVKNHIQKKGPVLFSSHQPGQALTAAMRMGSLDVIEAIKRSQLRGRGGAGFPTGQKWGFCRATDSDSRFVLCNIDEGEPGTFKDRVLMTERAQLVFEGMIIAGYAIEARQGFVYLRGEYAYLKAYLEDQLEDLRTQGLLGRRILGSRFSFDIAIKLGAGAYICGEESALIESAEGKRGQPRNRPPFPVASGYLHKPTIVNNPETYACAARIILNGPDWFKSFGTPASSGVKLLSVSGDCDRPGVYEVPWGLSLRELLAQCGARNTFAVQVGGPSGVCISEKQWDRRICYSDLGTGGAITIFDQSRDLLSILHNYMEFFTEETCGFCVPCRAGNTLLLKKLEKIMLGHGTLRDLEDIRNWGQLVKSASRCGLGQTSPNPLLTSIENFKSYFESKVKSNFDFDSQFDLNFAISEASLVAQRKPHLIKDNPT